MLRALEAEGWMKVLFPAWTIGQGRRGEAKALHDLAVELLLQGVHADMSAAQMQLLTAKMAAKDLAALKKLLLRPGFVEEWNNLDAMAAGFSKVLLAKENTTPSTCYKFFTSYDPEAILWLGFTSKDKDVQERFNLFLKIWPEVRQRIPHALMQEMRITPELASLPRDCAVRFPGTDRRPFDHDGRDSRLPGTSFSSRTAAPGDHQEIAGQAWR